MSGLKATNPISLQFLLNEDIYLVDPIQANQAENAPAVEKEAPTAMPETVAFDYLGENNKYFLLLINDPGSKSMAPKELEALQSILTAKKMELKDVALVNMNNYPSATFQQLKAYFACNRVVLFGIAPQQLQIPSIASNQISEHAGTKLLATFGFSEMMSNVDKKKAFWNVMKGF